LTHLLTALKDPGIAEPRNIEEDDDINTIYEYCVLCDLDKYPNTVHCEMCDLCIDEHDHHCP
jgi:hypothetical protein